MSSLNEFLLILTSKRSKWIQIVSTFILSLFYHMHQILINQTIMFNLQLQYLNQIGEKEIHICGDMSGFGHEEKGDGTWLVLGDWRNLNDLLLCTGLLLIR